MPSCVIPQIIHPEGEPRKWRLAASQHCTDGQPDDIVTIVNLCECKCGENGLKTEVEKMNSFGTDGMYLKFNNCLWKMISF